MYGLERLSNEWARRARGKRWWLRLMASFAHLIFKNNCFLRFDFCFVSFSFWNSNSLGLGNCTLFSIGFELQRGWVANSSALLFACFVYTIHFVCRSFSSTFRAITDWDDALIFLWPALNIGSFWHMWDFLLWQINCYRFETIPSIWFSNELDQWLRATRVPEEKWCVQWPHLTQNTKTKLINCCYRCRSHPIHARPSANNCLRMLYHTKYRFFDACNDCNVL